MPPKSKVEKSPHFNEILDMIKEGFSSYKISAHLKNEYNESISHTAINNYIKKIKDKTSSEYYKKKKQKEVIENQVANKEAVDEVVSKGVSDLDALDNIIAKGNELEIELNNLVSKKYSEYVITTDLDIAKIKIDYLKVVIQAINAKAKKLGDEPETNVNITIPSVITDEEAKELEKEIEDELR